MTKTDFYRQFEDRYRGSRDLIKERLGVYLPFVVPLQRYYPEALALDIGCGRGEWLELLRSIGFIARGIDIDDGMLSECRKLELDVETAEAIDYLKPLPTKSLGLVTGFHVAEHLSFKRLQKLLAQAYRVLLPGGLLILETPNPENLTVGASSFYLDPTHSRPLPPGLLNFVAEYAGFERVNILRLQENPALAERTDIGLWEVLYGVSPDYAIVAQKSGPPELMLSLEAEFGKSLGLGLDVLAKKYDQRIKMDMANVQEEINHAAGQTLLRMADKISDAERRAAQAESQHAETVRQLTTAQSELEAWAQRIQSASDEILAIQARLAEAEQRASEQEHRATQAETQHADAVRQLTVAQSELEAWAQRIQSASDEILAIQARLAEAEQRASEQEHRATQAETQHADAVRQLTAAQLELEAWAQRTQSVSDETSAIKVCLAEAQQRASEAEQRATEHEHRATQAECKAYEWWQNALKGEAKLSSLTDESSHLQQRISKLEAELCQMQKQAFDWHEQIMCLQRTVSWRITAPLRFVRSITIALSRRLFYFLRHLGLGILSLLAIPFLPLLLISIPIVFKRPKLRGKIGRQIKKYPKLRFIIRLLSYKLGYLPTDPRLSGQSVNSPAPDNKIVDKETIKSLQLIEWDTKPYNKASTRANGKPPALTIDEIYRRIKAEL